MNKDVEVLEYKGMYITNFYLDKTGVGYCISYEEECFVDEEEAACYNLEEKEYRNILNKFNAKQCNHQFIYKEDGIKDVCSSYFLNIKDSKAAIDFLLTL